MLLLGEAKLLLLHRRLRQHTPLLLVCSQAHWLLLLREDAVLCRPKLLLELLVLILRRKDSLLR